MNRATRVGVWLAVLTAVMVAAGCALFVADSVGWAQMLFVAASGTAGASAVLIVEHR